ncbi:MULTISPECIES: HDOD domain-containing protein [Vibrio]|uniref:EAL and HDOD domain-containing protein n=1 Tax=Vibrio TaxID=662 RepID=UPI0009BE9A47|nr:MULTISPECIES: HDOD domain-containing protein [Vibrio]USD58449.1 HDOD domain-containing protein [Vibrio sp. SCSIO 43155]
MSQYLETTPSIHSQRHSYAARQPLFTLDGSIYGYELLYRDGEKNCFPTGVDSMTSTSRIIVEQMFSSAPINQKHLAFINFDEQAVLDLVPLLLPKDRVVIELLESCKPTTNLLNSVTRLKDSGYSMALDDFDGDISYWTKFLPKIDYIKIDISQTNLFDAKYIISQVKQKHDIKFIAERVETKEDVSDCISVGFDILQGYYFSRPQIFSKASLVYNNPVACKLYGMLSDNDAEIKDIASLISKDAGLSVRLLSFVNAHFRLETKLCSVEQAVTFAGLARVRTFILAVFFSKGCSTLSPHIMNISVRHSEFMKSIAETNPKLQISADDAFLVGLFSTLPALCGNEWMDVISGLGINARIVESISKTGGGALQELLSIAEYLEVGDLKRVSESRLTLDIDHHMVIETYLSATLSADCFVEGILTDYECSESSITINEEL